MPITRATSSHIAYGNQEHGQDDGQEVQQPRPSIDVFNDLLQGITDPSLAYLVQDSSQPINTTGTSQPHEVHIGATDGNGGSAARPNNSAPPVVAATSIDGALPNATDSTQGYVTMEDLTTFLDKERSKHGTIPFYFHDERKGSFVKHVDKFLEAMGAHVDDKDLCLCEFSKSLSDRAYAWYTTLPLSSICSWDEMVEQFCQKYFQSKEHITILDLHNTRQCTGEDLMVYVKRFRDLALDCYGGDTESFLMEICINNMFLKYHAILENIGINQFARLLDAARRTTISVKAISIGKFVVKATEAILSIANEVGGESLNVEVHVSRAYLESFNAVTFTDEDMERKVLRLVNEASPTKHNAAGNEILAKHLDFFGEANHLVPLDKLPTLLEAQSTLTFLKSLKAIDLGNDPTSPRHVHISTTLSMDERAKMVNLLREYKDVFTWNYDEMPRLDPTLVARSLNVDPSMKPIVQPNHAFHPEVTLKIKKEVEKLLAVGFIKPTKKPTWLANIIPVRKKNGQIRLVLFNVLKKVFNRCRLYKLKMNLAKCAFGVSAGKFLGFLVSKHGISVDPAKFEAIRTMQPPKNLKQLQSFIGRVSYICKVIPSLVEILFTFSPLLKKGAAFMWMVEQPLKVYLFTSDKAMRALVTQDDQEGKEQQVYYRLRHYFLAHKIQLITKSQPIWYLLTRPMLTGHLANWLLQLSQYDIICVNPTTIKGQAVADLLCEFSNEVQYLTSSEVPGGEVATAQSIEEEWTLYFDSSFAAEGAGVGIVLKMTKAMIQYFHSSLIFNA
ncbi:hypothetical protein SLEP1_g26196 [Rubroshorea leprosula]|uniref:Retrotransposon gag domain-containing protein n=1 Tax=Rubroshorea leprosula TaxID=152421 RepID=A0AAV5JSD4_9ROSI|nr:hypothetical protein SLEP1_g26196 [Rubroshorea leprosula]